MPTKHFCCCLPVRFGVLVIAILTFFTSAILGGFSWYLVSGGKVGDVSLDDGSRTAIIITGAVFTVFFFFAILGLVGGIIRSLVLVRLYATINWIQLVAALAYGIFLAVTFFKADNFQASIEECTITVRANTNNLRETVPITPEAIRDTCETFLNMRRIIFMVIFVIFFLINLYGCIIVHRYGNQLSEEEDGKEKEHRLGATSNGSSFQGEQPHGAYPYAKPEHGYGHQQ